MTALRRLGLSLMAPAIALVVALVLSAAVIALIGQNPATAVRVMFDFGDSPAQQTQAIVVVLNRAVPLFLAGLAVSVAFRMGLFNIGVEGQYRIATVLAAGAGAAVVLPGPLHLLFIIAVAMAVGAFWAGIVAVLKVTRGVSEVISSIMLNFIALGLASYLLTGPLRGSAEGASIITTSPIPESGWFPGLNGVLTGLGLAEPRSELYGFLVVAVVVGIAVAVLIKRTRFGFDLRATGMSASAATASGVDARAMVLKTMLISGAIAGLIGMPDLLGDARSYNTEFTAGLGFLGIAVALLGRNSPLGIAFGALLFAFLDRAAIPLQFADIPASVVTIIQGTIVLAVVIANEVARRVTRRQAEGGSAVAPPTSGDGSTGGGQGPGDGPPPDVGPTTGTGTGVGVRNAAGDAGRTDSRQGAGA
ncbi:MULTISPECIES: ABC transporter permease [unclassified Modestobacter]|uniref:ABC transporter permease n=1 Tax=unclassified Modestobacter TaxID=2643866 RepID=UPI0022AAEBA4|nr:MULTISPECIES: ABC transporter permease [unclassified Modestobacter]MCZ2812274.1 ABC transporter permease [Modestobacter sp. VKM Ac-2979]MCZ2841164.1 ABC transporter permease [Modestobacter sp. VKM Ac-2980]MCZ2848447.1 ABC transporter permease [Modestobacter sp. VKM Ac-2978]